MDSLLKGMVQSITNDEEILINDYLPHNFLAEKLILSCLLNSFDSLENTIKILPIEAFYFKNHQEIYRAVILMYKNNLPIFELNLFL